MKKILTFIIVILINFVILGNSNVDKTSELSNDIVTNATYNTTSYYYNDSILYQDNKYATYYFKNLTENFGNNVKGSCTYIAFAMLLSYYDTYWNDMIIPENYDMITMLSNAELELNVESPGIYTENSSLVWSSMSTADYYQIVEQYSNAHLHLKLIQMGKEKFGQYRFDDSYSPCGLTYSQLVELMQYYLYDYMDFTTSEISYTSATSNVRQFVIDNIQNGKPVLVRMGSTTVSGIGHAFILYDYDEVNDELYGHWGWKLHGYEFEHIKLSTTPYDDFWDATVLNVDTTHNCSNNYKYSDEYNSLQTYCPCKHSIHEEHEHSYVRYVWKNGTHHISYCDCGGIALTPHVVRLGFTNCILCGGTVDKAIVQFGLNSTHFTQISMNGSFVLPNGIIVLRDEDIEAYLNGTLVFYNKNEVPVTQ